MRAVVQRASSGSVSVDSRVVGSLPCPGLVVLLGVHRSDTEADAVRLARASRRVEGAAGAQPAGEER